MQTELALFDGAKAALANAKSVDEVLSIRDRAEQLRLYARQAKDKALIADAIEIQVRAERRVGEILIDGKATGDLVTAGRPASDASSLRLSEIGITKKLSSKAQQLARLTDEEFRDEITRVRRRLHLSGARTVSASRNRGGVHSLGIRVDRLAFGELAATIAAAERLSAGLRAIQGFGTPVSSATAIGDVVPLAELAHLVGATLDA